LLHLSHLAAEPSPVEDEPNLFDTAMRLRGNAPVKWASFLWNEWCRYWDEPDRPALVLHAELTRLGPDGPESIRQLPRSAVSSPADFPFVQTWARWEWLHAVERAATPLLELWQVWEDEVCNLDDEVLVGIPAAAAVDYADFVALDLFELRPAGDHSRAVGLVPWADALALRENFHVAQAPVEPGDGQLLDVVSTLWSDGDAAAFVDAVTSARTLHTCQPA
jgi:hypothetical protein